MTKSIPDLVRNRAGGASTIIQTLLTLVFVLPLSFWPASILGAPATAGRPSDPEALALVEHLNAQEPTKNLSIPGVFKARHSDGYRVEIPVLYSVQVGGTVWQSIYRTQRSGSLGPQLLVVTHAPGQPNRYSLTTVSADGSHTNTAALTGDQADVPFADTDFWLSDLGLEFLHWPEQHIARDAKITMRLGRPCKVLESVNPHPTAQNYGRVVSWIDAELGNLIYAEAYDAQGHRFKVFSLRGFKRINGRWHVKDLELRNDKIDSRTMLEFDFEADEPPPQATAPR